jgi:hypothetical protein
MVLLSVARNYEEKTTMTISKEIEAKILRYHYVEKWRIGTIARELAIHHSVVTRVLSQTGVPKTELVARAPSEAKAIKLDNPAQAKPNQQPGTELHMFRR